MKLIIIYGSEASGKLTVAQALAARTGFKLFDNHISIDVGRVLYEYGDEGFNELVWKVRLAVFESAAKNDLPGLVFTWSYSHPDFQPLLDALLESVAPYNTDVRFVFLKASQEELDRRVVNEKRVNAGKIHTVEALQRQQKVKNHVEIPGSNSLLIDNTDLSPGQVVDMIIDSVNLSPVQS